MKKLSADNITDNDFTIRCPLCKEKHLFTKKDFDHYFLNEDDLDVFEVTKSVLGLHTFGPIFVCRNIKCKFMDTISIVNLE